MTDADLPLPNLKPNLIIPHKQIRIDQETSLRSKNYNLQAQNHLTPWDLRNVHSMTMGSTHLD